MITVTVMDNGGTANGGVNSVSQNFTVTVTPVNQAPTLNAITDPAPIAENTTALQTVNLTGISAGPGDPGQTLTVTATSSNPALDPQRRHPGDGLGDAQRQYGGRDQRHERRLELPVPADGHAQRRRRRLGRDGDRYRDRRRGHRVHHHQCRLGLYHGADGHDRPTARHRDGHGDGIGRRHGQLRYHGHTAAAPAI